MHVGSMAGVNALMDSIELPRFAPVRQELAAPELTDIASRLLPQLRQMADRVPAGSRIGVTAGSRGIHDMPALLRIVCDWVRSVGAEPVVIPAMGSHGGATAEGQLDLLSHVGVTEQSVGAPIVSNMDVRSLGQTPEGYQGYYSETALQMHGVIVVNRIKAHTDIQADVESGLMKMSAVGLGKHLGALEVHAAGLERSGERLRSIARLVVERGNILFGVGLLENALDKTRDVVVVASEDFDVQEPDLLAESRLHLPRLLLHDIDVLIVDYMGKNISGDGMDPNVLGRSLVGIKNPAMNVGRIVTLDLTEETAGNALGVGLADVITRRIFTQLDYPTMCTNGITSGTLNGLRIPPFMDNQRLAIQLGIRMCHLADDSSVRAVRIRNTLDLEQIYVSEALLDTVAATPSMTQIGQPQALLFDEQGNLF